jgi:hypothetical protein
VDIFLLFSILENFQLFPFSMMLAKGVSYRSLLCDVSSLYESICTSLWSVFGFSINILVQCTIIKSGNKNFFLQPIIIFMCWELYTHHFEIFYGWF